MLIEYPEDLSTLLFELPWWPSNRGFTAEAQRYDDMLIRHAETNVAKVYLVKNGTRRWITSAVWMEQNARTWDQVRLVSNVEIERIPLGSPLNPVVMIS
jgi:hypothetical protein